MSAYKKDFILSIVFMSISGFLFHAAYEWSGEMFLVGLVTPVNESVWEHMKLFFFPMLLVSVYLYHRHGQTIPFLKRGLLSVALRGTWLIPVLFYTYKGILGFSVTALDISTFYVSLLVSFTYLWKRYFVKKDHPSTSAHLARLLTYLCFILTILQTVLFMLFSYHSLPLGIFAIPST